MIFANAGIAHMLTWRTADEHNPIPDCYERACRMVALVVEGRGCPAAAQSSLVGLLGARLGGLAWAAYALATRAIGQADVAALFLSRKILLADFPVVRTGLPHLS